MYRNWIQRLEYNKGANHYIKVIESILRLHTYKRQASFQVSRIVINSKKAIHCPKSIILEYAAHIRWDLLAYPHKLCQKYCAKGYIKKSWSECSVHEIEQGEEVVYGTADVSANYG